MEAHHRVNSPNTGRYSGGRRKKKLDSHFQVIFQTVIDQVHLLHEKEEWHQEITDEFGAITELPDMFGAIVSESVQVLYVTDETVTS